MEIFFASATTDHSLEFEERGDKAGYSQNMTQLSTMLIVLVRSGNSHV
jgi:hypothetical protein